MWTSSGEAAAGNFPDNQQLTFLEEIIVELTRADDASVVGALARPRLSHFPLGLVDDSEKRRVFYVGALCEFVR